LRGARLHPDERRTRRELANSAAPGTRQEARSNLFRIWTAIPALYGTGVQRRTQLRRVPANHLRRFRRASRARAEIYIRRGEGGAGSRGFPGVGGSRQTGAASSFGEQREGGSGSAAGGGSEGSLAFYEGGMRGQNALADSRRDAGATLGATHAIGNGGAGAHGREYDAATDARRTSACGF